MATYAVGDIQGCLSPLKILLKSAKFNPEEDTLWIAGDLVNRGPESLEALRFAASLPSVKMVLGNHDLHLLAAARGFKRLSSKDTLQEIIDAPDSQQLLDWLIKQPLVHHDEALGYTMVHAGIPPIWNVAEALSYAKEVEEVLQSEHADSYFAQMYGNQPDQWQNDLEGMPRLRMITNYFTRMRFCDAHGKLELSTKTGPEQALPGYAPWFSYAHHRCAENKIIFGHWASLLGNSNQSHIFALDTGCVWGGSLTLMCLENQEIFSCDCDL